MYYIAIAIITGSWSLQFQRSVPLLYALLLTDVWLFVVECDGVVFMVIVQLCKFGEINLERGSWENTLCCMGYWSAIGQFLAHTDCSWWYTGFLRQPDVETNSSLYMLSMPPERAVISPFLDKLLWGSLSIQLSCPSYRQAVVCLTLSSSLKFLLESTKS